MCELDAMIQSSILRSVDVVAMTKCLDDAFHALQTSRLRSRDDMEDDTINADATITYLRQTRYKHRSSSGYGYVTRPVEHEEPGASEPRILFKQWRLRRYTAKSVKSELSMRLMPNI
jgi:hypothetical protein